MYILPGKSPRQFGKYNCLMVLGAGRVDEDQVVEHRWLLTEFILEISLSLNSGVESTYEYPPRYRGMASGISTARPLCVPPLRQREAKGRAAQGFIGVPEFAQTPIGAAHTKTDIGESLQAGPPTVTIPMSGSESGLAGGRRLVLPVNQPAVPAQTEGSRTSHS